VAISLALVAGAGSVVLLGWLFAWLRGSSGWARRATRLTRLLVVFWLGLTLWGTVLLLAYPAQLVLGYTADDAAAMAWLRTHAAPGDVVLNDGYADAGVWAPYKAGVSMVLPRAASGEVQGRARVVIDNVDHLDSVPEAADVVCAQHVRYVYRGARVSSWDARHFPPIDVLRASEALGEVFSQGDAVVFEVRLACRP